MPLFSSQNPLVVSLALTLACACVYADEDKHWSYTGEDGPRNWGSLNDDWSVCSSGKNQSPIDLDGAIDAKLPELGLDWSNPGLVDEINNGHTIQGNLKPGNYATIGGRQYRALQFHFHSPSEHMINGQSFPMEVHIVHSDDVGNLAVIGILFELGDRNPTLDRMASFRPAELPPVNESVDYNELVKTRTEYYSYNGSLTTPPCSEGVKWTVLKTPITASTDQVQQFFDTFGSDTNRPIQPHNARTILE